MRLVDTSAWVEWLLQSKTGQGLRHHFPARDEHLVPTIVLLELAVWARREMALLPARQAIADATRCVVVPLDTNLAMHASDIRRDHKLATADAIVYATAIAHNADLLTCDAHFRDLQRVIYIPKIAP